MVERTNQNLAAETLLTQMAVSSLFSQEAGRELQKLITRLTNGG